MNDEPRLIDTVVLVHACTVRVEPVSKRQVDADPDKNDDSQLMQKRASHQRSSISLGALFAPTFGRV